MTQQKMMKLLYTDIRLRARDRAKEEFEIEMEKSKKAGDEQRRSKYGTKNIKKKGGKGV